MLTRDRRGRILIDRIKRSMHWLSLAEERCHVSGEMSNAMPVDLPLFMLAPPLISS